MRQRLRCFGTALLCGWREFKLNACLLCRRRRITDDEAVELFIANPMRWFRAHNGPYIWSDILINDTFYSTADIGIYVGRRAIGYVEGIMVDNVSKTARIRHIAVSKGLEGRGLGYVVANALRLGLVAHYQVKTIVFAEDSTRYEAAGYAAFFTRLGAESIIEEPGWRPVWRWE